MIYCIDSNIFIWGIKRAPSQGQESMIARAEYLFQWMDENKHQVMIPTIVLAEVLAPEPLEKYPVLMEKISKNFMVVDFDARAASRYGQLFMNRLDEVKKVAKENEIEKQKMKIDHLIISCALVHGASCIYSNDIGLKAFGNNFIEVRDLPFPPPPPARQSNLFTPLEEAQKLNDDLPF